MKKIILMILVIVLIFIVWSCGLKIPERLPKNVNINYSKHLEFPITTIKTSLAEFANPLIKKFEDMGFYVSNENPITLSYATSIEFSPAKMLEELNQTIKQNLSDFATSISFSFSIADISNLSISDQIILPEFQPLTDTLDIDSINIGDITLLSTSITLYNGSFILDIPFSTDKFSSINILEALLNINKNSTEIDVSKVELEILINDQKFVDNSLIQNLTLNNGDTLTLVATYTGTTPGNLDISMVLSSVNINRGNGLNIENVSIHKSLSPINIDNKIWNLYLFGTLDTSFNLEATNVNINTEIIVKSNSEIIAQGNPVTFDQNKKISADIPLNIEATITLSGNNADIDLTTPVSYTITPNISIEKIKNYPVNLEQYIALPEEILETEIGTGTLYINFSGLTNIDATGLINDGTNTSNLFVLGNSIALDLSNISLPATFTLQFVSGDVDNNTISFTSSLSDDFEISQAKISNSLLSNSKHEILFNFPHELKDYLNTADATVLIQLDYAATNISDLTLKIQSNFLENKDIPISGKGTESISNTVKTIDFSSMDSISITIEATGNPIISNVKKSEIYGIEISATIPEFEIDNFNVKSQKIGILPELTFIDFSSNDDAASILKNFETEISMPIKYLSTDTTIDSTLSLLISGELVELKNGDEIDIGPILNQLIKNASPITFAASLTTDSGILTKTSIFGLDATLILPLSGTPLTDTPIFEETIDISDLKDLVDILDSATLKFAEWKNTTGINAKVKILDKEFALAESTPILSLSHEDFLNLLNPSTLSILLPKDIYFEFNQEGVLDIAPYIVLDLTVATNISLEGRE
ncbi:hypothetical protein SU69_04505 [Thermosipho melanesiensis]|uniref:Uncharacterized protein n=2 Tax=Thermosipho melanesiensis TaxID=46541 RepID=A6LLE1_THEM4|nr:hypothetical protein [Thermosipho melanesiensis]ABR30742.1 hypothetical protein Tmel_0881 [Thermosipho melanesiensis BI429]APT74862.1 hypothetical protein BW47_04735 [Thermosipho melanesiensis]OOC35808.1 hypothetical protein SU68_04560 [Thermosipho melanesiensis]OOC38310.1 hypothetical protein SU69_04505 [Thermosipho melanesiensis]OOC38771.1 hypothetical protein SU70_04505 [Thermosipho melanesiensis]